MMQKIQDFKVWRLPLITERTERTLFLEPTTMEIFTILDFFFFLVLQYVENILPFVAA